MLDRVERLIDQVVVVLPALHAAERRIAQETAPDFILFDVFNINENATSRMLGFLLDPKGTHGQGDLFLRLFVERFVGDLAPWFNYSEARTFLRNEMMDITLTDDTYFIGMENKVFKAREQACQAARYLTDLHKLARQRGDYRLIYLSAPGKKPGECDGPGENSLPRVARERHQGKYVLASWAYSDPAAPATQETASAPTAAQADPRHSCIDWLRDCEIACHADSVRWFLRQFQTFIQSKAGQAGGSNMSNDTVIRLALRSAEDLDAAFLIFEANADIKIAVAREFLRDVLARLEDWVRQQGGDWEVCHRWPCGNWIEAPSRAHQHILLRRKAWPALVGAAFSAEEQGPSNVAFGVAAPTVPAWLRDKGEEKYGHHTRFILDPCREKIAAALNDAGLQANGERDEWWIGYEPFPAPGDWRSRKTALRLHRERGTLAKTVVDGMTKRAEVLDRCIDDETPSVSEVSQSTA